MPAAASQPGRHLEAAPDEYTLYQPVLSTFVSLHRAAPNVPLHVPKDFLPIGFVAENPMFIAVSPSLGISTLPELIALAKSVPAKSPMPRPGWGDLTHLTGELLQHQAGIKLLLVPYTGGPSACHQRCRDRACRVIIEGYSGVAGAARSGSVKLIAVASAKRLAELPESPPWRKRFQVFKPPAGLLVAPACTSEAIIGKVSEDLRKVVVEPELEKKLATLGSYTNPMSPTETTAFVHKQQQMWQPVLDEIAKRSDEGNVQARLCSRQPTAGRCDSAPADRRVVRRL